MRKQFSVLPFIFSIILSCSFRTTEMETPKDQKQILDIYFQSYKNSEFYQENGNILVLSDESFSLNKNFVPSIVDKINKYEKYSKLCDQVKDSNSSACGKKTELQKFKNVFSIKELDNFRKLKNVQMQIDYSQLLNEQNIQVVDSSEFFKTKFNNNGVYINKLEFRGPFFTNDKSKALLEVYYHNATVNTTFLVFNKKNDGWIMIGNVKF
jgi:hypothetical protein